MKLKSKKGFTIIELVIVIAVIGILTAVLVPTFINLTNKANQAADQSLVKNLNTALKAEEQLVGHEKAQTLQGAIEDLEEEGYLFENLVAKSGQDLLWDQEKNEFLLNDNAELKGGKYWQIVDAIPSTQKFSYYAGKNFASSAVDVKYGFDAGRTTCVTSVNYDRLDATVGQTVAIRTNSYETNLTINAPLDTVYHIDEVGKVTIDKIDMNCYYEKGQAAYVKINEGKVVAKDGGEIAVAFAANNNGTKVAVIEEAGKVKAGYTVVQPVATANVAREGGIALTYAIDEEHAGTATPEEIAEATSAIEETGELSAASETGIQPAGLNYTAVVNNIGFDSLAEAVTAAPAGSTVSLLKDVVIAEADNMGSLDYHFGTGVRTSNCGILLEKSVTINGNNHSVTTTDTREYSSSFGINGNNLEVTFKNINSICKKMSNIFVGENSANLKLNIVDSYIEGTNSSYCLKTCSGVDNMTLNIIGSTFNGWNAVNLRSNNSKIFIEYSNLRGTNGTSPSVWNDFATIVFDGDASTCHDYGKHGTGNKMEIVSTVITSTSESTNTQDWLNIQYGAINNVVKVDSKSTVNPETRWGFNREQVTTSTDYPHGSTVTINGAVIPNK